jgi:hypothetical protein
MRLCDWQRCWTPHLTEGLGGVCAASRRSTEISSLTSLVESNVRRSSSGGNPQAISSSLTPSDPNSWMASPEGIWEVLVAPPRHKQTSPVSQERPSDEGSQDGEVRKLQWFGRLQSL